MLTTARHFDSLSGAARPTHGSLSGAWGEALAFGIVVAALFSIGLTRGLLMLRTAHRGPMLLIAGLVLLAYSTLALAQQAPPNYGPDWSVIATAAVGVVTLLVGAYAKGLDGRVGRAELQLAALHRELLKDYHTKAEVDRTMVSALALVRAEMAAFNSSVNQMLGELQRIRGSGA